LRLALLRLLLLLLELSLLEELLVLLPLPEELLLLLLLLSLLLLSVLLVLLLLSVLLVLLVWLRRCLLRPLLLGDRLLPRSPCTAAASPSRCCAAGSGLGSAAGCCWACIPAPAECEPPLSSSSQLAYCLQPLLRGWRCGVAHIMCVCEGRATGKLPCFPCCCCCVFVKAVCYPTAALISLSE
jgi:hypothetical protein